MAMETPEALMWKWLYNPSPRVSLGLAKVSLGVRAELVLSISPCEHHVASLISSFGLICVSGRYFK